jgi:peptidoglycan/LPS O-acetylase OafA/YrhL
VAAKFNANVHGCRGLFASLIFVHHVSHSTYGAAPLYGAAWDYGPVNYLLESLQFGVELFFCISGYVISMSLVNAAGPAAFLRDRALRIMPVFLVIHFLLFAAGPVVADKGFQHFTAARYAWVFLVNMALLPGLFDFPMVQPAAWSLSYEMAFYVIAALTYFSLRLRPDRRSAIIALSVLCGLVMFDLYPRAIFFSVGVFAYLVDERLEAFEARAPRLWTPFPYMVAFLLCWYTIERWSGRPMDTLTLHEMAGDARLPMVFLSYGLVCLFFLSVLHDRGWFGAALKSRPLQYLGTISYSFYLWHPVVMYVTKRALVHDVLPYTGPAWGKTLFFIVSLPLALGVSHLSYRLIEQRLTRAIRRRLGRIEQREPLATVTPIAVAASSSAQRDERS